MINTTMNKIKITHQEPVSIPPEYRKGLVHQVLKGTIHPADFPGLFEMVERITITLPNPDEPDGSPTEHHPDWVGG